MERTQSEVRMSPYQERKSLDWTVFQAEGMVPSCQPLLPVSRMGNIRRLSGSTGERMEWHAWVRYWRHCHWRIPGWLGLVRYLLIVIIHGLRALRLIIRGPPGKRTVPTCMALPIAVVAYDGRALGSTPTTTFKG